MVQVQVPDGAVEGSTCTFTMPSGAVVQVVVPQGAGPGSVLEVADPGAAKSAVAVQAYTAPHTGVGEVVGIVPHGQISEVSGVQAVGPQSMPPGYDMLGDKYGILARPLAPREEFQSEPGAMVFFSDGIDMSAKFGGVFKTFSQAVSGEALVKVSYVNQAGQPGYVALTPNQPFSMVVPVDLRALPGQTLNVKRGAYMAGTPDVFARAKLLPAKNAFACCCGGLPPIIQEVHGDGSPNSRVFLSIGGTVVVRRLNPGEEMIVETRARIKLRATPSTRRLLDGAQVDTNTVVGFENTVGFDVRNVGSFLNCCLGGEGCFNTVFTGPGNVYLQSISVDKLMQQLVTVQQDPPDNQDNGGGAVAAEAMRR